MGAMLLLLLLLRVSACVCARAREWGGGRGPVHIRCVNTGVPWCKRRDRGPELVGQGLHLQHRMNGIARNVTMGPTGPRTPQDGWQGEADDEGAFGAEDNTGWMAGRTHGTCSPQWMTCWSAARWYRNTAAPTGASASRYAAMACGRR